MELGCPRKIGSMVSKWVMGYTLPETNSSHLKIGLPNRKVIFQPSIFCGYVSFREGNLLINGIFGVITH